MSSNQKSVSECDCGSVAIEIILTRTQIIDFFNISIASHKLLATRPFRDQQRGRLYVLEGQGQTLGQGLLTSCVALGKLFVSQFPRLGNRMIIRFLLYRAALRTKYIHGSEGFRRAPLYILSVPNLHSIITLDQFPSGPLSSWQVPALLSFYGCVGWGHTE